MTPNIKPILTLTLAVAAIFVATAGSFAADAPLTPIITPCGGSFKPPIQVGVNSFTPGATIHYTLDGSAPTASSPVLAGGALITLTSSKTIRAVASDASGNVSDVAGASFSISGIQTTEKPVFEPGDTNATEPVTVAISTATPGASIYYTTDGSDPSRASRRYRGPFKLTGSHVVVRAIAVGDGRPASPLAQAVYRTDCSEQVKAPAISGGSPRFDGWTVVSIVSPTSGAVVRYTTDGSEPGAKSTLYCGPKTICVTTILKARAFKAGMADSAVATARFEADDKPPTVLDVSKYGALPSNPDNTQAVQSAFNDARNALEGSAAPKRIKIVFPTGAYHFMHGLTLDNANNVDIDGQGSTFIFHNAGYQRINVGQHGACANVAFENMIIDSIPLPCFPGRVVNSTGSSFDFVLDPGYEAVAQRYSAILEFDPVTRNPKPKGVDIYYKELFPTVVDAHTLHFNLPYGKVTNGMYLNVRCARAGHTFLFGHTDGILMRNIRLYSGNGSAFVPYGCENVTIDRFVVMIKPGRSALSSNDSDDLHILACKGPVEVKDCDLESQGDDGINLAGSYSIVTAVDGNKVSIIFPHDHTRPPTIGVGDVIEIVAGQTMLQSTTALVTAVTSTLKSGDTPATEILTLDHAPQRVVAGTDLVDSVTLLPRTNIERCNFIGNRARGVLVQFPDTTVQDCSFINVSGSGVHVSTVAKIWYEGSLTRDVVIKNNSFLNCNYLWKQPDGTIHVYADNSSETTGAAGTHERLAIVDNTVMDTDHPALTLSAVDDVDVIGNVFDNCVRAPDDKSERANSVIYMHDASRLRLHDNIVSHTKANGADADRGTTSGVVLGGNTGF